MPDARVDRTNTERMVCNSQVRTKTDTETDTETTATDTESTHSTIKQNETFSDMCWFCTPEGVFKNTGVIWDAHAMRCPSIRPY